MAFIPNDGGLFEPADGSPILPAPTDPNQTLTKTFKLAGGPGVSFKSGDTIQFIIGRSDTMVWDTCQSSLLIMSMKVKYTTR